MIGSATEMRVLEAMETASSDETAFLLSDDEAWEAVSERDRRYDGHFVFAVKTTGIYCRPSCPARRPHRENVVYFATSSAAEAAGYRACRRCHPDSEKGTPAEEAVEQARAFIDDHLEQAITLERLADEVHFSPTHLQRIFKRFVGLSPKEYQDARRLEAYKASARESDDVLDAAFEAGYGSSRALYAQSQSALGMTPATYRRGGEGLAIQYTTLPTAFGRLLVAVTERGICAVSLGDDDDTLIDGLEEEFPNAVSIERNDEALHSWAEPIVNYLNGVHAHPIAPVDLQGSDFQRRVWKTLQQIPYGETRSYGEIATMLGQPAAARAVAQACASNKIALVIPCHRVIRQNGAPGGYRWGTQRKKRLLALEQDH